MIHCNITDQPKLSHDGYYADRDSLIGDKERQPDKGKTISISYRFMVYIEHSSLNTNYAHRFCKVT